MRIPNALASSALAAAVLFGAPALAGPNAGKKAGGDRVAELEQRLADLEARVAQTPKDVSAYQLPDEVDFCGEPVNLDAPGVRERLEKEFYLVLGDRAQVVLWIKRARRVFPTIEKEAKALGTCADLKYLAVIESGLRPAVTSRASAKGWWQFMSGTGKQYGLDVDRAWDQRADLGHATRAGLSYLVALEEKFGSWPLAMAGYNTGPGRLQRAQEAQGIDDFWQLDLYTEAERYVPRTIAIKLVMDNLEHYGFQIGVEDGWAPEPKGYVKVTIPRGHDIEILEAARKSGIPYRTLRQLNPEMGTDVFPSGREIVLEVPQGREGDLRTWMTGEIARLDKLAKAPKKPRKRSRSKASRGKSKKGKGVASSGRKSRSKASKRSRRTYKVRRGDSLWSIAQAHDCSVKDLRAWNKLGKRSVLKPGQKLVVRR